MPIRVVGRLLVSFIGADHALHDGMSDHIFDPKLGKGDALYVF
jgi:hypothetical protein